MYKVHCMYNIYKNKTINMMMDKAEGWRLRYRNGWLFSLHVSSAGSMALYMPLYISVLVYGIWVYLSKDIRIWCLHQRGRREREREKIILAGEYRKKDR